MAEPFLGEIRLFSGYVPAGDGWAACNGQLLPINQNQALFSLLGTMYGGNGQTTFALPDLRGRCALHVGGSQSVQGVKLGEEAHTITQSEMPLHLHFGSAAGVDGDAPTVAGNMLGAFNNGYRSGGAMTTLIPSTVGNVGGSQAHLNMMPYLTINFGIALIGIFPSRN